ncbi:MAG: CoA ester lyase [Gammaproteobacteria bacterium AqS3]|nr:CoA ester lyase [Gammaproteobacteria bacterium AqS3]
MSKKKSPVRKTRLNWRSLLFVPAHRPDRFERALNSGADAICIDWEDAVGAEEKHRSHEHTARFFAGLGGAPPVGCTVRINSVDSPWFGDDLAAVRALPSYVMAMPAKARFDHIDTVCGQLDGRPCLPLLEDAVGIEQAYQITAIPQVLAVMLGGVDLAAQLGAGIDWDALLYARSRMVMAAAAGEALAIDVPSLELDNADRVCSETERAKSLGFRCKAVIHPKQIEPVHRGLAPSEAEVNRARGILQASAQSGGNAVAYEGIMLDEAVLLVARSTLRRAGINPDDPA